MVVDDRRIARSGAQSPQPDALEFLPPWGEFWSSREPRLRNALAIGYLPVVHRAVGRLPAEMRSHWESEDLESFGLIGLLDAIDRFEEGSDPRVFPAYALRRVRGAIYDELRRLDWLPRSVRRRVVAYRRAVEELSGELARTPSAPEVIAAMGLDSQRGHELMSEVQTSQLASIQAHDSAADRPLSERLVSERTLEPEFEVVASAEIEEMRSAVESLPERQRAVINLRFTGGLTQSQVAEVLGVSTSRISQIESAAIGRLREVLRVSGPRLEQAV